MAIHTSNSAADFGKKLRTRIEELKDRVNSMRGKRVIVGIPQSARYPNGKSVAEVANLIADGVLDNGAPSSKPPRPFIRIATEENRLRWNRIMQDGIREALRAQQKPNLRPLMIKVGERMQHDIKETMMELDVYDTGRMHNSISILQVNNDRIQA